MNPDPKYSFKKIYSAASTNGYGKPCAERRFSILQDYEFKSVLDVGSGPCLLHDWLKNKGIDVEYSAVDIRSDALALCKCPTYTAIPTGKQYDLVCLFGTVTYNIDCDVEKNKNILKTLLLQSKAVCASILLFTVFTQASKERFKNTQHEDFFVHYSNEEIDALMSELGITDYKIINKQKLDMNECFVVCKIKN